MSQRDVVTLCVQIRRLPMDVPSDSFVSNNSISAFGSTGIPDDDEYFVSTDTGSTIADIASSVFSHIHALPSSTNEFNVLFEVECVFIECSAANATILLEKLYPYTHASYEEYVVCIGLGLDAQRARRSYDKISPRSYPAIAYEDEDGSDVLQQMKQKSSSSTQVITTIEKSASLAPCVILAMSIADGSDALVHQTIQSVASTFQAHILSDGAHDQIQDGTEVTTIHLLVPRNGTATMTECILCAIRAFEHFYSDLHLETRTKDPESAAFMTLPTIIGHLYLGVCVRQQQHNSRIVGALSNRWEPQPPIQTVSDLCSGELTALCVSAEVADDFLHDCPQFTVTALSDDVMRLHKGKRLALDDIMHIVSMYSTGRYVGCDEEKLKIRDVADKYITGAEGFTSTHLTVMGPPACGRERLLWESLSLFPSMRLCYVNCGTLKNRGSLRPIRRVLVQLIRFAAAELQTSAEDTLNFVHHALGVDNVDSDDMLSALNLTPVTREQGLSRFGSYQSFDASPETPSRRLQMCDLLTEVMKLLLPRIPGIVLVVKNAHMLVGVSLDVMLNVIRAKTPCLHIWLCDSLPRTLRSDTMVDECGSIIIKIHGMSTEVVRQVLQSEFRSVYYKPVQIDDEDVETLSRLSQGRSTVLSELVALLQTKRRLFVNPRGKLELILTTPKDQEAAVSALSSSSLLRRNATEFLVPINDIEAKLLGVLAFAAVHEGKKELHFDELVRFVGDSMDSSSRPALQNALERLVDRGGVVQNSAHNFFSLSAALPVSIVLHDRKVAAAAPIITTSNLSFCSMSASLTTAPRRRSVSNQQLKTSSSSSASVSPSYRHSNGPELDRLLVPLASTITAECECGELNAEEREAIVTSRHQYIDALLKLASHFDDPKISSVLRSLKDCSEASNRGRIFNDLARNVTDLCSMRIKNVEHSSVVVTTPCPLDFLGCNHTSLLQRLRALQSKRTNSNSLTQHELTNEMEFVTETLLLHWRREDAIMVALDYPHVAEHRASHRSFAHVLWTSLHEVSTGNMAFRRSLQELIERWEGVHHSTLDMELRKWLLSPEIRDRVPPLCERILKIKNVVMPELEGAEKAPAVVLTTSAKGWKPKRKLVQPSAPPPPDD
eukprot:PhM_4_TR16109/c0_g1_i1/m.28571